MKKKIKNVGQTENPSTSNTSDQKLTQQEQQSSQLVQQQSQSQSQIQQQQQQQSQQQQQQTQPVQYSTNASLSQQSQQSANIIQSVESLQPSQSDLQQQAILKTQTLCKIHGKIQDIVCILCKMKICSDCALFDQHKNHKFERSEDIIKLITEKAEGLLEITDKIKQKQLTIQESVCYHSLLEFLNNRKQNEKTIITNYFTDKLNKLKEQQEQTLRNIDEVYVNMQNQAQDLQNNLTSSIIQNSESWRQKITQNLEVLFEGDENQQCTDEKLNIQLEFFNNDFIKQGLLLIQQLEQSDKSISSSLEQIKSQELQIKFNENSNFTDIFQQLCQVSLKKETQGEEQVQNQKPDENQEQVSEGLFQQQYQQFLQSQNAGQNQIVEQKDFSKMESLLLKGINCQESIFQNNSNNDSKISFQSADQPSEFLLNSQKQIPSTGIQSENQQLTKITISPNKKQQLSQYKPNQSQGTSLLLNSNDQGTKQLMQSEEKKQLEESNHNSNKNQQISDNCNYDTDQQNGRLNENDNGNDNIVLDRNNFDGESSNHIKVANESGNQPKKSVTYVRPSFKINKAPKISDKFEPIIKGIKTQSLDVADFTCADIGDEGIVHVCEAMVDNTSVKNLKLVKNKLTDTGAITLLSALLENENLQTLNLAKNQISEAFLDKLLEQNQQIKIKNIYLNQNIIGATKCKKKIEELKRLGIQIYI